MTIYGCYTKEGEARLTQEKRRNTKGVTKRTSTHNVKKEYTQAMYADKAKKRAKNNTKNNY